MSDALSLPAGTPKLSRSESTLAEADIEEIVEGETFRTVYRGTGRLVRVEAVHHYRQTLMVRPPCGGSGEVVLAQQFSTLGRLRAEERESTTIVMSRAEARRIGRLLIEAADADEGADAPGGGAVPQDAGTDPKTASMTSAAPERAAPMVSELGSSSLRKASSAEPSEQRLIASLLVDLSALVDSLACTILISSRKIAWAAVNWPNARSVISRCDIPSSIVSRQLDGSWPGEAVEHHARGLARAGAAALSASGRRAA